MVFGWEAWEIVKVIIVILVGGVCRLGVRDLFRGVRLGVAED